MIALIDDLDQQKVTSNSNTNLETNSNTPKTTLARLRQAFANCWATHQKRKTDRVAVYQLMQFNDALLKDMGLARHELMSVSRGSSTLDSLVKKNVMSNRDNAYSTTSLRK